MKNYTFKITGSRYNLMSIFSDAEKLGFELPGAKFHNPLLMADCKRLCNSEYRPFAIVGFNSESTDKFDFEFELPYEYSSAIIFLTNYIKKQSDENTLF